jgi:hypothetical protein
MPKQHGVGAAWLEEQALYPMLLCPIDLSVNACSHVGMIFYIIMHGFVYLDFASSTFLQFLEDIKMNHLL